MKKIKKENRPLALFFLILILASAVAETLIITIQLEILYPVLMWIPAIAAMAATGYRLRSEGESGRRGRLLRECGVRRCRIAPILLACLLPMIYLLIPYLVYWKTYPENFAYTGVPFSVVLLDLAPVTVIGVFGALLTAAGEEIGWRGFLLPELRRNFGMNRALVISSLIWCAWHLPLLIFGDYMEGAPLWYKVPAFILCIFPVGIMAGLLTFRTDSIWPAAFLHAAHNNYDQAVFSVITRGDNQMLWVSETGWLTVVCAWILAVVCYLTMRNKLRC